MTDGRAVARAVDALKRGWPVAIDGVPYLAIETADEGSLAAFDADGPTDILISGSRAATLKLANQRDASPTGPVRVRRATWLDLAGATALADPASDLANPLQGPFQSVPLSPSERAEAALRLARLARLLPAFFVGGAATDAVEVGSGDIMAASHSSALRIASRARLPTRLAEQAEIVAFRALEDASEHVALVIGAPGGEPPLVRLHSECLTGDVLGSLKCDCGPQLEAALAAIGDSGWGVLLYLRQEGRAIGLINKLRAYALQDQGFDTVDANLRLGFGDDERHFGVAAAMLRLLGQERVRLLTNNPRKVSGLQAEGIAVIERVPLKAGLNPHNAPYLETKRLRSGHQL